MGLSLSLRRHLNWTLKSLKVAYSHDDEHLPLRSFTPELIFPHSSLNLILEGRWTCCTQQFCKKKKIVITCFCPGRWTSPFTKSAEDPLCEHPQNSSAGEGPARSDATFPPEGVKIDSKFLPAKVTSTEISGSFTVNTCIVHYRHQEFTPWLDLFPWEQLIHRKAAQRKRQVLQLIQCERFCHFIKFS